MSVVPVVEFVLAFALAFALAFVVASGVEVEMGLGWYEFRELLVMEAHVSCTLSHNG
jgi:hypothetical protein